MTYYLHDGFHRKSLELVAHPHGGVGSLAQKSADHAAAFWA